MTGPFALGETEPTAGAERGSREGTTLALTATITIRDLDTFVDDPSHAGSIEGDIAYDPVGSGIRAPTGVFNLFSPGPEARTKFMIYELGFQHRGEPYYLAGRKTVRNDPGFDLWTDTTTLHARLHRGIDATAPVAAAGIIRISAQEFTALLAGIRAIDPPSPTAAAKAVAKFGVFFAGELWKTYGPFERRAPA